jgi:protein-export membrane protein SecD/preprotein translocase SecF subunit
MPSKLRWKWIVILGVFLACIVGLVQFPKSKKELIENWNESIRLGLDLKGGTYLEMQIQVQDAFKTEADRALERLREALEKAGIRNAVLERNDPNSVESAEEIQIVIKGIPSEQAADARRIIGETLGQTWIFLREEGINIRLGIGKGQAFKLRQDTVMQCIHTIQRKIDSLGLAETVVQQRGGSDSVEILVQLPGVDDPVRVKEVLRTQAQLELSDVIGGPYASQTEALINNNGSLPANARFVRGLPPLGKGETWWLISRSPVIAGIDLRDARAVAGEFPGHWETVFMLTPGAAERFEKFTKSNIGNHLAIVLDSVVLSAPRIDAVISDQGRITGAKSFQDAADLALNLKAGSLPAGIKTMAENTVGPSLGSDSIHRGILAAVTGLALVIASMLGYYRGAGLNAVAALLLNTILTIAALSWLDWTWTLPGIAGLVLSIGIAVDSNVLIFERIKEELRSGRLAGTAVSNGFKRALLTIIDTHVTTVAASAFLFVFGTGPVKGFAVTLVLGLVANLFTAVFVSRAIFEIQMWRRSKATRLSIGSESTNWFNKSAIDFMKWRNLTLSISVVAILMSIAGIAGYGLKPGIDFRGGTLVKVAIAGSYRIEDVRSMLSAKLNGEVSVQEAGKSGIAHGEKDFSQFIIGTALSGGDNLSATRERIQQVLQSDFGKEKVWILSAEIVSPRASAQMKTRALMATIGALGGMLLYIAFSFKWLSGVAAILATIHDVIITLGLFAFTGREIDLSIVAALLTLIGYSTNDTIVVFDRVRENLRSGRSPGSFLQLVNDSVNQTLSRTLLTAGLTLLACLALYFLGGEVLNGIAFALLAGIVVGTYSSIFVASSILVLWKEQSVKSKPHTCTFQT